MDYGTRQGLDKKTTGVIIGCLLGAVAGGYFLYQDLNAGSARGQGTPLAKIERREAKVRRKPGTSFAWAPVQANEDLFRKDSVQTGAGSAAAIRFSNGSVVELGEESLIVIDTITDLSVPYFRGSAILRTEKGDARLTADKDGKAKVEALPVQLLSPENLATLFTPEGAAKPVRFAWKPRQPSTGAGTGKSVLQISADRAFRAGKFESISPAISANELVASLKPGRYYWRVVTEDNPAAPVVREVRVAAAQVLRPVWPTQANRLSVWNEDSPIQFRWAAAEVPGEHVLEVARDNAFRNLVASESVRPENAAATLRKLPEGTIYWRLRSRYGDLAVESAVERFEIERAKRIPIELTFPMENGSIELQPKLRFSWLSESPDADFQLEVQSVSGQKPVTTFKGKASSYLWEKPVAGAYRWRVQALMQNQVAGESPWRSFSIYQGQPLALKSPSNNQELRYWDKLPAFDFEWSRDSLGEVDGYTYQLQLAQDPGFKGKLIAKSLKGTKLRSAEVELRPGMQYWRVAVIDQAGAVVKTSESAKFTLSVHAPLKPPIVSDVLGANEGTYNYYEQRKDPVLSWAAVDDATAYEVTVYAPETAKDAGRATASAGAAGGKILLQKTTTETKLELKGLREGVYSWVLRPIDRINRKGEATVPRKLNLTYGKPLRAPVEVLTPEVQ